MHTGHLVVTMPKLTPTLVPEAGPSRPARFAPAAAAPERDAVRVRGIVNRAGDGPALRERSTTRAAESEDESASDDDDEPPPLT